MGQVTLCLSWLPASCCVLVYLSETFFIHDLSPSTAAAVSEQEVSEQVRVPAHGETHSLPSFYLVYLSLLLPCILETDRFINSLKISRKTQLEWQRLTSKPAPYRGAQQVFSAFSEPKRSIPCWSGPLAVSAVPVWELSLRQSLKSLHQ